MDHLGGLGPLLPEILSLLHPKWMHLSLIRAISGLIRGKELQNTGLQCFIVVPQKGVPFLERDADLDRV